MLIPGGHVGFVHGKEQASDKDVLNRVEPPKVGRGRPNYFLKQRKARKTLAWAPTAHIRISETL